MSTTPGVTHTPSPSGISGVFAPAGAFGRVGASGDEPVYGAIEGGGTKFVVAVGHGPDTILARIRLPTTTPEETLGAAADFLAQATAASRRPLAAVGMACFGPVELDPSSPLYGHMLDTPKPGWQGAPLIAPLTERLGVPVALDTDVNGAALAEWRWGAAQHCDPTLYLTVGTGIGGGAIVGGRPLHGLLHPEMGHIPVPRLSWPDGTPDTFAGSCPYHGPCLEGMAAGPALRERLGAPAEQLDANAPIWELEAGYIAYALATYTLVLSPRRIVLGGGVFQQAHLLERVRRRLREALNGYIRRPQLADQVDEYVVAPYFGQDAGLIGGFALAQRIGQLT